MSNGTFIHALYGFSVEIPEARENALASAVVSIGFESYQQWANSREYDDFMETEDGRKVRAKVGDAVDLWLTETADALQTVIGIDGAKLLLMKVGDVEELVEDCSPDIEGGEWLLGVGLYDMVNFALEYSDVLRAMVDSEARWFVWAIG